jgi:hypothetical protein
MAKIVQNPSPDGRLQRRSRRTQPIATSFPWDTWMDGNVWELTQGEDFHEPKQLFQTCCHYIAREWGYTVVTRSTPHNEKALWVQFTPKPGPVI